MRPVGVYNKDVVLNSSSLLKDDKETKYLGMDSSYKEVVCRICIFNENYENNSNLLRITKSKRVTKKLSTNYRRNCPL